jgi:hypothetical protein
MWRECVLGDSNSTTTSATALNSIGDSFDNVLRIRPRINQESFMRPRHRITRDFTREAGKASSDANSDVGTEYTIRHITDNFTQEYSSRFEQRLVQDVRSISAA